jgi:hypothetical protein
LRQLVVEASCAFQAVGAAWNVRFLVASHVPFRFPPARCCLRVDAIRYLASATQFMGPSRGAACHNGRLAMSAPKSFLYPHKCSCCPLGILLNRVSVHTRMELGPGNEPASCQVV